MAVCRSGHKQRGLIESLSNVFPYPRVHRSANKLTDFKQGIGIGDSMNETEIQKKQTLLQLLKEYEKTEIEEDKGRLLDEMNKVSSIPVEQSFLDQYWSSMSADEFCTIHSVIPEHGRNITHSNITEIIELLVGCVDDIARSEYYLLKYEDAVEYFFKKNSGSLREILGEDDEPEVAKVISKMSKPDVINLNSG